MRLLEHPVRFGDTTLGPAMHSATLFDLLAVALEELGAAVDYPFTEILANGGTPYAPVDVRGCVTRYPVHGETVRIEGDPVEIGERSFAYRYVFQRAADGAEYCRMRVTHVTIDADGDAEPLPDHVHEALETALSDEDAESAGFPSLEATEGVAVGERGERIERRDDGSADDGGSPATFSRDFRIQTPHVEAADWGYFEEYFRFMSQTLEAHIAARGVDLAAACDGDRQLQPLAWHVTFEDVVPYGSTLTVHGRSIEPGATRSADDGLTVRYRLDVDRRPHIRGVFEYACWEPGGAAGPVPADVLAALQGE